MIIKEISLQEYFEEIIAFSEGSFSVPVRNYVGYSIIDKDKCLGAFIDDKLVGTVVFSLNKGSSRVNFLSVNSEFRRKKIGTKLMLESEEIMKENSDWVFLNVRPYNTIAIEFYKNSGYTYHDGFCNKNFLGKKYETFVIK